MPDIRDERERGIALDRVGITRLVQPVVVRGRSGDQETVASVTACVGLAAGVRAVHMSRFVSVLARHAEPLTASGLAPLLEDLRSDLGTRSVRLELTFTFFVRKRAPRSGAESRLACEGRLAGWLDDAFGSEAGVRVPVLTVCPCSAGAAGGLGQRGYVTALVRPGDALALEDLVEVIEEAAGSPVYPLLRGTDEQAVLESALGRPLFVEDLARSVAGRLDRHERVDWFSVSAENLESAHDHSVFAALERRRGA